MLVLKNIAIVVVVLAAFGFVCSAACFATPIQVLVNGSFENGTLSHTGNNYGGNNIAPLEVGSATSYINWWSLTATSQGFAWVYSNTGFGAPTPEDGVIAVDLLGALTRTMYQSFSVSAGTTYTASFWSAYRDSAAGIGATLAVNAGTVSGTAQTGGGLGTLTLSGSGTGSMFGYTGSPTSGWTQYSFTFTPTQNATATLTFNCTTLTGTQSSSGNGAFLDNASVTYTPTPEPGTLALLAAGLAGLLCYAWRKRP